jgi:hypothetical protein
VKITVATNEMGLVVVADEAILSIQTRSAAEAGATVLGGAIGGAVASALARGSSAADAPAAPIAGLAELKVVHSCAVRDLPTELRSSPGWPRVEDHRQVVVFPRRAIQEVAVSFWRGLIIKARGKTYYAAVQLWEKGKLKRHLAGAGYPLA